MYTTDYQIDAQAYEEAEADRKARAGYTDATARRSSASIIGAAVDIDNDPGAMARFINP